MCMLHAHTYSLLRDLTVLHVLDVLFEKLLCCLEENTKE